MNGNNNIAQESEEKKAIRAGIGYTIGNILVKGIAFLTLPIFTNLMTTSEYGLFNTYSAYLSVFSVIVSLGLPTSVRNARLDLREREQEYYSNSVVMILITMLSALALAFAAKGPLTKALGISDSLLFIIVINSACVAVYSYYNNILMIDYRHTEYLKLSAFYSGVSVLLSILLIWTCFRVNTSMGRILGGLIPMLIIAVFVLYQIWRKCKPTLKRGFTKYGLRFGIPLIPNDLSSIILNQFDRIMIYRIIGQAESGLYSFAYNVAIIYQVVSSSVDGAWTPWMFGKLSEKKDAEVKKGINIYAAVLSVGTIFLLLCSPEIIIILSSEMYWDSKIVIVPIITAMYFFAIAAIPVGMEFYCKKTSWISFGTLTTAVCNIVLNLIFIPKYGYSAAAFTTLFSYFIYFVFHVLLGSYLVKINLFKMPVILAVVSLVTVSAVFVQLTLENYILRWGIVCLMVIITVIFGVVYRKKIAGIIRAFVKS